MSGPSYTWSDAWVLAAVTVGGGGHGAELAQIIEAGEVVNRSIFTPQELRRGLGKLLVDEHVRRDGERFVLSGIARIAYEQERPNLATSYDLLQFFEEILHAMPYPAGDPNADDPDWSLPDITDAKVAAARAAYLEEYENLRKQADSS